MEHVVNESAYRLEGLSLGSLFAENYGEVEVLGLFACSDRKDLGCEQLVGLDSVQPVKPLRAIHQPNATQNAYGFGWFVILQKRELFFRKRTNRHKIFPLFALVD